MKESTPRTSAGDARADGSGEPSGAGSDSPAAADEQGEALPDAGGRREDGGDRTAGTDPTHGEEPTVEEVARLREEVEELTDRHLRLAAEFTNFRRRTETERSEAGSRAQSVLLSRLLDVFDDLERVAGLDLGNATVEAIMEGVDLVERKVRRALGDAGVEVIDPVGEPFDPNRMEAMMRVPAPSRDDDDRVAQVLQKGYQLQGILVRPARVSVYKAD